VASVKIDTVFELVFLDVVFDDLDRIFVSPGKTGTAQTYDQFLLVFSGILVHDPVKIDIISSDRPAWLLFKFGSNCM
jgi:hypothetical protein